MPPSTMSAISVCGWPIPATQYALANRPPYQPPQPQQILQTPQTPQVPWPPPWHSMGQQASYDAHHALVVAPARLVSAVTWRNQTVQFGRCHGDRYQLSARPPRSTCGNICARAMMTRSGKSLNTPSTSQAMSWWIVAQRFAVQTETRRPAACASLTGSGVRMRGCGVNRLRAKRQRPLDHRLACPCAATVERADPQPRQPPFDVFHRWQAER